MLFWKLPGNQCLYYIGYKSDYPEKYCMLCLKLVQVPIGLVIVFAGWLADVYFRRYRVLIFVFIAVVILVIISIIYKKRKREDFLPHEHI